MNIPPKYEDVVAQLETERARITDYIAQRAQTELQLDAALGREAALREEASCLKAVLNGMEFKQVDDMVSDGVDACLFLGQESARIIKGIQAERDALREELESIKASVDGYDSPEHAAQVDDELGHQCNVLQQRLAVAEQRAGEFELLSVKQAALLDELGIPLDEVDDLFGETLKNAKRYEYLRSVMAIENFPDPHPEWSEPSEVESKRIDDLCDSALKPAEGEGS